MIVLVEVKVKVQRSLYRPEQALRVPGGWDSRFHNNRHTKMVRLSAYAPAALPPRKYSWHSFLLEADSDGGIMSMKLIVRRSCFCSSRCQFCFGMYRWRCWHFVYSSCYAVFICAYPCFGISIATSYDKDYNQGHILTRFISATSSGDKGREQYLICNNPVFSRSGSVLHSVTLQLRKIFCFVK
jgi:hypothetical protein